MLKRNGNWLSSWEPSVKKSFCARAIRNRLIQDVSAFQPYISTKILSRNHHINGFINGNSLKNSSHSLNCTNVSEVSKRNAEFQENLN